MGKEGIVTDNEWTRHIVFAHHPKCIVMSRMKVMDGGGWFALVDGTNFLGIKKCE